MIINLSCSSTALLQSQMVRQLPTTQSRALFSRLLRNALPGFRYSTPASEEGEQKEKRGGENATGRDRAREENGEAPRGEDQGLAKSLFHHWADHHRQNQRRGFVVEFFHQIPQDSKDPHYDAVADIVADAVGADEAEQEDEGEQDRVGHSEEPGPHWYERQIQDQKHGVADVHAGDNPPEDIGGLLHEKGAGLKPFFLNDTAHTEIYTLSLHDALPIPTPMTEKLVLTPYGRCPVADGEVGPLVARSEEHTSELQSHVNLVCRLLLE